jgi:hypothetical protein
MDVELVVVMLVFNIHSKNLLYDIFQSDESHHLIERISLSEGKSERGQGRRGVHLRRVVDVSDDGQVAFGLFEEAEDFSKFLVVPYDDWRTSKERHKVLDRCFVL